MPCNDVTERLTVRLDHADRVVGYSMSKMTCGGNVKGDDLLDEWILDRDVETVLAIDPADLASRPVLGRVKEYLRFKHLFSVQAALAGYLGRSLPDDDCAVTIVGVEYDRTGAEVRAEIHPPLLTEKIEACGLCGDSCGGSEAGRLLQSRLTG